MERITTLLQRRVKSAFIVPLAAIAVVVAIALGSSGCQSFVEDWHRFFGYEEKSEDPNKSEFFVCNYWQDNNENGKIGRSELVGVKNDFRAHETITLMALTIEKKAYKLMAKLYNGERELIRMPGSPINSTYETIISFNGEYSSIEFKPWQLHALGGVGEYSVEWYLNKNRVSTQNFTLIE